LDSTANPVIAEVDVLKAPDVKIDARWLLGFLHSDAVVYRKKRKNTLKLRVLIQLFLYGAALPIWAASYYPIRPQDARAVYLTKDSFAVHGDGQADDSAAIQSAIDRAAETHDGGIVFVPEGHYRITRTIYVWRGVRIIGYGPTRPVFVLPDNTPGYQQGLAYMFFFSGGYPDGRHDRSSRPPVLGTVPSNNVVTDADTNTFFSAMSNVDIEIGKGNTAAVGIRFHVSQHCYLAHMDFRMQSGLAALKDVGNEAEDLHFYGGRYGIITERTAPTWQFTLLDSTFEGQTEAAIREHEVGLTLIHDTFRDVPRAVLIDPNRTDELWVQNSRFENISGPAITIGDENSPRTEINLENILCRNVKTFALLGKSGRRISGQWQSYKVKTFSHGLTMSAPGGVSGIRTSFDAEASLEGQPATDNVIAPLPPMDTWVNLQSLGAKGDGVTDDTAAIQAAIAGHRVLYIPMGRYLVSDTIHLRADTVLIGLNPNRTHFDLADGTTAFQGPGAPRPLLEAPTGGHNIVTGIGLSTGRINSRAVGVMWMAGADSLMEDVFFLGGFASETYLSAWDTQYPSLWITNGGGGTFADIWSPSSFARAGLYVSNTATPGHVYEFSCEHHVRNEIVLDKVENWDLEALQTEEERVPSPLSLPLEISQSRNITIANYRGYRVTRSYQPLAYAVKVSESRDIRFRNMHVNSSGDFSFDNAVAFDNSLVDTTDHKEVRAREFALLNVPGKLPVAQQPLPSEMQQPRGGIKRLATGFYDISGAAVDSGGTLYFVDVHSQRIYRWSPLTREAVVVRESSLDPENLAFDRSDNLLVISGADKGIVYAFRPGTPETQMTLLKPEPVQERPGMTAFLASGVRGIVAPPQQRPWQYVSPDRSVFIPAGNDFIQGHVEFGIKDADVLRALSIVPAVPGHPFYVTDDAGEKTYKGTVAPDGTVVDLQLFTEEGGNSVVQDQSGNVYLAAGDLLVYSPEGKQIDRVDLPERPINLIFGGPDRRTLYILTRTSLYALRTRGKGL
jgi:hypothetical protein